MWFKDCEREEIAHAWVGRQCSNMDDGCCRKRMMSGALVRVDGSGASWKLGRIRLYLGL
jgi:hypothetical protein